MTSCERLSDRMPEVARGQGVWTPEELLHLDACPACRQEWRLIQLAAGLGRDMESRLDPGRMAQAVAARLGREREERRGHRRLAWGGLAGLAAAAAIALLLLAPWRARPVPPGTALAPVPAVAAGSFLIPLSGIDSLDADQLESVLETMEMPLTNTTSVGAPSLQELDDQQLERVLSSLEG